MSNSVQYRVLELIKSLAHPIRVIQFKILSQWIHQYYGSAISISDKPAIVISPHQDDETLGCGGLIALKRQQGIKVAVIFLTDGSACPGFNGLDSQKIIDLRQKEATTALGILGVSPSDIYFFNYPDGKLKELSDKDQQALVNQLSELFEHYQVQEVYAPHFKDAHCDHEAAFQIAKTAITRAPRAIELFQYPIWLFWKRPLLLQLKYSDLASAQRLNISSVKAKKHEAMQAYQSQLASLPSCFLNSYPGSSELFFAQLEHTDEKKQTHSSHLVHDVE
jgi:N-acetylglucosamine malate deacetylase 1